LKKTVLTVFIFFTMLILQINAFAYPISIKDARGKVVRIKSKPVRIISLAASITETLFALGLDKRIVGVTNYCNYPAQAKKKTNIGDLRMSDELIISLKPDLIFAVSSMNDNMIPKLERLGITVFALDPKTIEQAMNDIITIGKITDRQKTASEIEEGMKTKIESVKKLSAKKSNKKVLVVIQPNPLWAAGPKTFMDEMIKLVNAKNIAFDARAGFVPFSKELAIQRNPDIIILGSIQDMQYFIKSKDWRLTNAVKNKKVFIINSDLLVRPGPRIVDGLSKLAEKVSN
jgi:iron complex transport system substrate-binding protein